MEVNNGNQNLGLASVSIKLSVAEMLAAGGMPGLGQLH